MVAESPSPLPAKPCFPTRISSQCSLRRHAKPSPQPPETTAGRLAVAASQTIGQYLLPRLITGFLKDHPRVEIAVTGGNTQAVLEALVEHRVQLALIEGPAMRRDVKIEPFMEDHMVCVVPPGHEWADDRVDLADLRHAVLVTRELGSGSRRIVEQALEEAGFANQETDISA